MRTILTGLILYAVYSVVKTFSTAQELSMAVVGINPSISQGQFKLSIKMKLINKLQRVVFNSIQGQVLLNNKPIGTINYNNNDVINTGTTIIYIPVYFDPLLDTANVITIINEEGFKNISVKGSVVIDNIQFPYDNEIINSDPFKNFKERIDAAKL